MVLEYLAVDFLVVFLFLFFFFSSRRRHTRCALVTGVQTCALPISEKQLAMDFPDPGKHVHVEIIAILALPAHSKIIRTNQEQTSELFRIASPPPVVMVASKMEWKQGECLCVRHFPS